MLHVTEALKDMETAARELEEVVKRYKFGVLYVHDLQKTLNEKGLERLSSTGGEGGGAGDDTAD